MTFHYYKRWFVILNISIISGNVAQQRYKMRLITLSPLVVYLRFHYEEYVHIDTRTYVCTWETQSN